MTNRLLAAVALWMLLSSAVARAAQLKQQTLDQWNQYIRTIQAEMNQRRSGQAPFLWLDTVPDGPTRTRRGEILVAPLDRHTPDHVSDGLIHHWIGAAFIPGARIDEVLNVVRNYARYKSFYKPTVIDSGLEPSQPASTNQDKFFLRIRNESLLSRTALDATYTASYFRVDPRRSYIVAQTSRLQEVDHYGEATQRTLPPDEGAGYLWRMYTISRFEQRDGGVYVEVEAIALSRDIPSAVRWFVEPIVRRVSRDALTTSLSQTGQAVHTLMAEERKAGEDKSPMAHLEQYQNR